MKCYPCNGKRCPIQYNAISSVENCKLFDKCNFYEPRKTPECESLMKILKDEFGKGGERDEEN